jgi:hypothetical protein
MLVNINVVKKQYVKDVADQGFANALEGPDTRSKIGDNARSSRKAGGREFSPGLCDLCSHLAR